jgi:capsule synthesis protein PGA_cap
VRAPSFAFALLLAAGCAPGREPELPALFRPDPDGIIDLVVVGDVMPARDVEKAARKTAGDAYADRIFAEVAPVLRGADVAFANFECAASGRGHPVDKQYTMRADPAVIPAMARAGFDVLSLANNHSLDYGERALRDTWGATVAAGMVPVGVRFVASTFAQRPGLVRVGSRTLAFLAYTDVFPRSFRGLSPGPFPLDEKRMADDIRRARARASHVIVSLHVGHEYALLPTRRQREMARAALDAGATLVVEQHTHTPQPIEVDLLRGRATAFGLGNFVFDLHLPWKRYRVRRGELLRVRLDDRLRDVRLEPVALGDDNRPRLGGDLDVASLQSPYRPPGRILWSLEEALPRAAVERVSPSGPAACSAWTDRTEGDEHALDGFFRCGDDFADAVGRSADLSAGRWRSVVRVVPRPDSAVRLTFSGVPRQGRLVGFAGLSDWAAAETDASPVLVEWTSPSGAIASLLLSNEAGWKEFAAPLPAGFSGPLSVTVSATRGRRRHVGLGAWITE